MEILVKELESIFSAFCEEQKTLKYKASEDNFYKTYGKMVATTRNYCKNIPFNEVVSGRFIPNEGSVFDSFRGLGALELILEKAKNGIIQTEMNSGGYGYVSHYFDPKKWDIEITERGNPDKPKKIRITPKN